MTKHTLLDKVKAAFEDVFKNSLAEAPLLELGSLLTSYQNDFEGDVPWLIRIASQCATRAETEKQWNHLRHFQRLMANWQKKSDLNEQAVTTEEQRAESYLCDANDNPTSHGKAHWVYIAPLPAPLAAGVQSKAGSCYCESAVTSGKGLAASPTADRSRNPNQLRTEA